MYLYASRWRLIIWPGCGRFACRPAAVLHADYHQSKLPLVWLPFAIEALKRYHNTFGPRGSSLSRGRDVVDIVNNIEIPIPKMVDHRRNRKDLLFGNKMKPHFAHLLTLLPELQRRLFYSDSSPRTSKKHQAAGKSTQLGRLNMKRLTKIPRTYGVPVSLRRTTEWLFSDFATLIADPFLFDTALDMCDIFGTFLKNRGKPGCSVVAAGIHYLSHHLIDASGQKLRF